MYSLSDFVKQIFIISFSFKNAWMHHTLNSDYLHYQSILMLCVDDVEKWDSEWQYREILITGPTSHYQLLWKYTSLVLLSFSLCLLIRDLGVRAILLKIECKHTGDLLHIFEIKTLSSTLLLNSNIKMKLVRWFNVHLAHSGQVFKCSFKQM